MKRLVLCSAVLFCLAGQSAQASVCDALAVFFKNVVKASKVDYKPETLLQQIEDIQRSEKTCEYALAKLRDAKMYTHRIGAPLTPLQGYLIKDARFSVDVVGEGDTIEAIEFDVDEVGVLRRRPTR